MYLLIEASRFVLKTVSVSLTKLSTKNQSL